MALILLGAFSSLSKSIERDYYSTYLWGLTSMKVEYPDFSNAQLSITIALRQNEHVKLAQTTLLYIANWPDMREQAY